MTIEEPIVGSDNQHEKELTNNLNEAVDVNSTINVYKSINDITPIVITPLSINILQQFQKSDSNVITSLPSNTMISPASLKADKPKNLTPEEKRQRRLWRNRLAAQECRKKKKLYIHDMEGTIERLTKENASLRQQVEELKVKVAALPDVDENFKLMREVEILNAKLEQQ